MFVCKGPRGVKDCIERASDGSGSDSDEPVTKEDLLKVIFISYRKYFSMLRNQLIFSSSYEKIFVF